MKVTVEPGPDNGFGTQYRLRILDGYRAGELVRAGDGNRPLFDVNRARLVDWARETGYEVAILKGVAMNRKQYQAARRLIRDNGRAAYRWLGADGEKLQGLADVQDWLAERADIVAYCKRQGIPCTARHTARP
jgi:hypothetical protein